MGVAHRKWKRLGAAFAALGSVLAGCAPSVAPPLPLPPPAMTAERCLRGLDESGVVYQIGPIPASSGPCVVDNPVRVSAASFPFSHPTLMSCALALDIDRFLGDEVQPLARYHLKTQITRLDHLGAYSCRGSTGQAGRWSEHAAGRAIDISGFELANGAAVSIERDWYPPGPKRDFLRAVAERACRYFSVVLTPDSNKEHYNHIHVDIGPYRLCSL
jgi:hypothetical protein